MDVELAAKNRAAQRRSNKNQLSLERRCAARFFPATKKARGPQARSYKTCICRWSVAARRDGGTKTVL